MEAAFATDVVKTLSAEAPTLATVTVVTSEMQSRCDVNVVLCP